MIDSSIGLENSRRWLVLGVVVAAQFMVVLDIAIVNVALPSIKSDLGFSEESLQWVISAYAILFGGFLLLGGRLADMFGRRRVFALGLAIFVSSSLLCGLAWSEGSLIGFRAVQGLGGALLAPATLSILMTTFAEGRDRNLALGIWGAASGSGGAAGVLLGGVLTSYLSWPWIFFINVPVGLAVIAVTPWLLHESRSPRRHRRFDFSGAVTGTAGLMLLVYALTRAAADGWGSTAAVSLLTASALLVVTFVAIELRSRAPLLPMRIFRMRTLAAGNAASFVIAAVTFSEFFLLTLYMQQVLHYSAIQTGVAFLAITLTIIVFSNVAQALVTRLGVRSVLATGLLLTAVATAALSRAPVHGHYFWDLFPAFVLTGVAMPLTFVPMTIAGLAGVRREDAGVASGLINTSRQIGGAVGLAAVSTIAAGANGGLTHGFHTAFYVLAGLAAGGALLTALLVESQPHGATVVSLTPEALEPVQEAA